MLKQIRHVLIGTLLVPIGAIVGWTGLNYMRVMHEGAPYTLFDCLNDATGHVIRLLGFEFSTAGFITWFIIETAGLAGLMMIPYLLPSREEWTDFARGFTYAPLRTKVAVGLVAAAGLTICLGIAWIGILSHL